MLRSNLNTATHFLFIPFSAAENPFSLYLRALNWRYNLSKVNGNVPNIIMYRDNKNPKHTDNSYADYKGVTHSISENDLTPNSVIYIIADGTGDPDLVTNLNFSDDGDLYCLPIDLVATRIKEMGLTRDIASWLKSLKLYICDENRTNKILAQSFAHALGSDYNYLDIHYYTSVVTTPQEKEIYLKSQSKSLKITKKFARDPNDVINVIGFASEHKVITNVSTLIQSALTHRSTFTTLMITDLLKKNKAALLMSENKCSPITIEDISPGNTPIYSATVSTPVIEEIDDDPISITSSLAQLSIFSEPTSMSQVDQDLNQTQSSNLLRMTIEDID